MENYNRITKPNARKMFNRGCDILLLPCKVGESALDGTHSFIRPVKINILSCPHLENNFDRTVNEYEYCTHSFCLRPATIAIFSDATSESK